jgi:hypothetical protein
LVLGFHFHLPFPMHPPSFKSPRLVTLRSNTC